MQKVFLCFSCVCDIMLMMLVMSNLAINRKAIANKWKAAAIATCPNLKINCAQDISRNIFCISTFLRSIWLYFCISGAIAICHNFKINCAEDISVYEIWYFVLVYSRIICCTSFLYICFFILMEWSIQNVWYRGRCSLNFLLDNFLNGRKEHSLVEFKWIERSKNRLIWFFWESLRRHGRMWNLCFF